MVAKILLLCLSLVCFLFLAACRNAVTEARETPNVVAEVATSDIPPDTLTLPNKELSIKFAVIGDSGRGIARAARDRGADGRVSPAFRLRVRADGWRQHLRGPGDARKTTA